MALPSTVNTTGLVIVVSGLYGRDEEFKYPNDCGGGEVIGGVGENVGVEGVIELAGLLSWEVVEGGVEEGVGVDGDVVGVNWSVLVVGGWLGVEGDSKGDSVWDGRVLGTAVSVPVKPGVRVRGESCLGTKTGTLLVGIKSGGLVK